MGLQLLDGEKHWLQNVVAHLADDDLKLVYADWLEERGDLRAGFVRDYVKVSRSMSVAELPTSTDFSEEWLELIGYRLVESVVNNSLPELKEKLLRVARPALRMLPANTTDELIPIAASKIGGLPDLPPGYPWPPGGDCHAIYNDDTGGTDRLAGFLAQVNFAEIADTLAGKDVPATGLLSFFCFQDIENDNPDAIGAKAVYFPDVTNLVRTQPPKDLTEGNTVIPSARLNFAQTLDVPEDFMGPWSEDLKPPKGVRYAPVLEQFRLLNFHNMLGYARATSGEDPTPSKHSRHLIILKNAVDCMLHIQISAEDLAARNFDAIMLSWVDFD